MNELLTALKWWPAITYALGVLAFGVTGGIVWYTDDDVTLWPVVRLAITWPWLIRGLRE